MVVQNPVVIPQGLKPHIFAVFFGPAEAVPLLQNLFLKYDLFLKCDLFLKYDLFLKHAVAFPVLWRLPKPNSSLTLALVQ